MFAREFILLQICTSNSLFSVAFFQCSSDVFFVILHRAQNVYLYIKKNTSKSDLDSFDEMKEKKRWEKRFVFINKWKREKKELLYKMEDLTQYCGRTAGGYSCRVVRDIHVMNRGMQTITD